MTALAALACGDDPAPVSPDAPETMPDAMPDAMVSPDGPGPTLRKSLFYLTSGTVSEELWELPLGATTPTVVYAVPGTDPDEIEVVGDKVYFTVSDENSVSKVWVYDPSAAKVDGVNPRQAFSINAPTVDDSPFSLAGHEGKLYLSAVVNGSPHKTFVYDPALPPSATNPKVLFDSVSLFQVVVGSKLVARSSSPTLGEELFVFDLTQPQGVGNPQIFDLNPGAPSSQPNDLSVVGTKVYLCANQELYVYDTSLAGSDTNPRRIIAAGTDGSGAAENVLGPDGKIYSRGATNYSLTGTELMIYDPAVPTSGTNPAVFEFVPGPGGGGPGALTNVGGKLAMNAYTPATGYELYLLDPALALSATNPTLIDIAPGATESAPRYLVADGTNLYFTVDIVESGVYLVQFDSALPINVTVNPRTVFMGTGSLYELVVGSYYE